jgi:hypothetical protein
MLSVSHQHSMNVWHVEAEMKPEIEFKGAKNKKTN